MKTKNCGNESFACRVCLEYPTDYIDFRAELRFQSDENEVFTYLECFEAITNIHINLDSNPNQCLCIKCGEDLKSAFIFLRRAQNAEKFLCVPIEDDIIEEIISNDDSLSVREVSANAIEATIYESISNDGSLSATEISPNAAEATIYENTEIEMITASDDELENEDELELNKGPIKKQLNTNNEFVECEKCGYKCKDSQMPEHNRLEHDLLSKFNCHICSKAYKSSYLLNAHLSYHRRKKPESHSDACAICGKIFATSYYLQHHIKLVHTMKRPKLACDQCDKVYISKNALNTHKRIHSGQTWKCLECNKLFCKKHELNIHMRFHRKDYPFDCSLCGQKFAIKGHLKTHMLQHQGYKLQCEDCGKLFSSSKSLQEHSYVHGIMPFPCVSCSKGFPTKQKYKIHLKRLHSLEFNEKEHLRLLHTQETTSQNESST